MTIELIVTHPGSAHKDDFLACCLLAHLHGVPVQRREPTEEDLANPEICVVDVGGDHNPELKNFDHHQFPRDSPPRCALSLVLLDINLYDDACSFLSWLRTAEWLDTLGPNVAAERMGIPRSAFSQLNSPIDMTLLNRFARESCINPVSAIYQVMVMIGEDIISYLQGLRERLNYLKEHCEYWAISKEGSPDSLIQVVFVKQSDEIASDPSFGIHAFISEQGKQDEIHAMVYPDRRGNGYGLTRYEDYSGLDFSRIENQADVRFAHKRGFVAKVEATSPDRLKELIRLSMIDSTDSEIT
ncbi:MAG: MYG1 family protein [Rubripirellula sp.]